MPASVYVCVPVTSPVLGSAVAFDVGVPSPQSIVAAAPRSIEPSTCVNWLPSTC